MNRLQPVTTNAFRIFAIGSIAAVVTLTGVAAEPDYFAEPEPTPAVTAEVEPAGSEMEQAKVLRWKTSRITRISYEAAKVGTTTTVITASHSESAPQASSGLKPAFKAPAKPGTWNTSRVGTAPNLVSSDGAIRLVAHDAHSDPFGDRAIQAGREPALAAPAGTRKAALANQVEEPAEPDAAKPMPKAPANLQPADDLPSPMGNPMPDESLRPMADAEEGTDTYNYRDCGKAAEGCKLFRDSLRGVPLSQISLNIMPTYKPDAKDEEESNSEREKNLALSKSRVWHDRSGRVLATGRFSDLRGNKVHITDDMGNEVAALSVYDLGDDEMCFLTGWWRLPGECQSHNTGYLPAVRGYVPSTYVWTASALCHKPLYFEEVQLERYGHTAGPFKQPVLSGAHFFLNIAALPYKMAINPPRECQYALGYYRPGNCAPWHIPPIPLSVRGAAAETGAWVGGIFIIP